MYFVMLSLIQLIIYYLRTYAHMDIRITVGMSMEKIRAMALSARHGQSKV
ncbi:hypothetical protein C497_16537 [Halalkalicoccus jeotgali B3]|uniref:Uncharacterized protein n=1 Tax=Halalkalicoccus jeotgali (strain DSM 18796 / CECT 7217 / JCM 14584 / KCTC 4019 / B3) TaxID=795797 RepID=D8J755_HALJB|nr:hypothetical protein HacjB3_02785 [Halalkalicoccus jeotgali B3]ELY34007.1 hypothetical protein C497_16537 [Halalkalicoccus jeotgali B3]